MAVTLPIVAIFWNSLKKLIKSMGKLMLLKVALRGWELLPFVSYSFLLICHFFLFSHRDFLVIPSRSAIFCSVRFS